MSEPKDKSEKRDQITTIVELLFFRKQLKDGQARYVANHEGMFVFPHRDWPRDTKRNLNNTWCLVSFTVMEGNTFAFAMPVSNLNVVREEIDSLDDQDAISDLQKQIELHCTL
jgi:hypothetical protein